MDIWSWLYDLADTLEETDPGLMSRLVQLPSWVVDGQHDQVDAAVPELLAAARRLEHPWLEVFVRHWRLQSWVFHRHDIRRGMPEALTLLERSHRDDMVACPQTTCVTQDVCAATGHADGPGYAEQRLAISAQTLQRIHPKWPCFVCISSEHMSALIDAGRPEEALKWASAQIVALRDAGETVTSGEFCFDRAQALVMLQRPDEALELLEQAEAPGKGDHFVLEKQVRIAWVLTELGRHDDAVSALPPFARVRGSGSLYGPWARASIGLVRGGAKDWSSDTVGELATIVQSLAELGCPRQSLDIALAATTLCIERDSPTLGEAFLAVARAQLAALHRPLGAPAAVQGAADTLHAVPRPEVAASAEAALALLNTGEVSFGRLWAAHQAFPGALELGLASASGWAAFGFPTRARETLRTVSQQHPESPTVYLRLGQLLADAGDWEAVRTHVAAHPDPAAPGDLPGHAAWLRAVLQQATGDPDGALQTLEALWTTRADWCGPGVPAKLAGHYRERGRLDEAFAALQAARAAVDGTSNLDWDLLTVGTRLGRWPAVRAVAAALGMAIDPDADGPIAEDWGMCRVRYPDDDRAVYAARTGPVTARVLQIRGPEHPERLDDAVVFDATRLDDDGDDAPALFAVDAVLELGGYSAVAFDGVHPGTDALEALRERLNELGATSQVVSGDAYRVVDPVSGTEHPGVYLKVATRDAAWTGILDAFEATAATTAGANVWAELLDRLQRSDTARSHRELARQWGM